MGERKSEAINLRMAPSTKELLRRVAESEHRTLSNMLEVLIRERAEKCGLESQSTESGPVWTKKR